MEETIFEGSLVFGSLVLGVRNSLAVDFALGVGAGEFGDSVGVEGRALAVGEGVLESAGVEREAADGVEKAGAVGSVVFEVARVFFVAVWVEVGAVALAFGVLVEGAGKEEDSEVVELFLGGRVFFVEFFCLGFVVGSSVWG